MEEIKHRRKKINNRYLVQLCILGGFRRDGLGEGLAVGVW